MHSYKKCVFPHVRNFTLIYGLYSFQIDVLFGPILMENFVSFFKCLLNFRALALQFKHNKVGYTNFAKFNCRALALKLRGHLKKQTNHVFVFILLIPT